MKNIEEEEKDPFISVKEKLNKNSYRVFIGMLVIIIISSGIAIYRGFTREKVDFKTIPITNIKDNIVNDFESISSTYSKYESLSDLENELDYLLEKETLTDQDSIKLMDLYKRIKLIK